MFLFYQFYEPSLAQHGVAEIEASELDLLWMIDIQLVEEPVVEWTMVLKFERTERMGYSFYGI